jgi:hypothetical protein
MDKTHMPLAPHLTPPTPPVPLAGLLARADLGLRQVAGPRDDGTEILWVHTSELEDPGPYLLGGELLLSAGVHFDSASGSGAYLDRYVARAAEAGAAALGFGLAPVHDETPRALIAACDRYDLPLLEVPPQTPFTAVTRAVWQAMAEVRHRELRRLTEAQQSLAAAAARPAPVPAVLRQLAQRLGGWTALIARDGAELYEAGPRPGEGASEAAKRLAAVVRPADATGPSGIGSGTTPARRRDAPSSATDTVGATSLAGYALAGGTPGAGLALVIATARRDPADHAIAGIAVVLLSLLTGRYRGPADADRATALVRLLLGARPEDIEPVLSGHGAAGGGPQQWTVVHGSPRGGGRGGEQEAPAQALAASALAAGLGTALVDPGGAAGATVRLLLPADREVTAQAGWTLGVSGPVSLADLATADAEAERALRRAVANRTAMAQGRSGGTGVTGLVAPKEARAHARSTLAPVLDSPVLAETLRTWLALHGSWDRTAVALEVHRNTVRQRIGRAAALLEADLDNPDTRMDLWFALRWL